MITGQVKLGVHAMQLCQVQVGSVSNEDIKATTDVALLRLLESRIAFNNVFLRHYLFCILQVLAGRWVCIIICLFRLKTFLWICGCFIFVDNMLRKRKRLMFESI